MLRALNAMHEESDPSISSEEAFNSEDEAKYGKFFASKSNDYERAASGVSKLLGIQVAAPKGSGESDVVTLEVLEGTKLMISSGCLDVPNCEFAQLRLLFRCLYETDDDEDEMPWMCLSNILGSVLPSMSLALEIVGRCIVQWKVHSTDLKYAGTFNIFGQIVPTDAVAGGSEFVNGAADMGVDSTKVKNRTKAEHPSKQASTNDKQMDVSKPTNKASKRKLSHDMNDKAMDSCVKENVAQQDTAHSANENSTKLTKKQRKQLAEEKAKQLEETLTAARETESESKPKKKKKKKQSTEDAEPKSKATSLTRERRLPGGILIRDILIGTGTAVSSGRKISLHYTGSLLSNGKVFDKNHSRSQPLQFRQGTGEVIRGLERGLEGMKVGGERVITVPAALGYGEKGMGVDIPPDSDLVFEVKVLKVG